MSDIPTPNDIVIAVMGMTGVGKSSFINYFSAKDVPIGNDLESCTEEIGIYKCSMPGVAKFYLVDTPGFDDSTRSDADVLEQLARHLAHAWHSKIKLSGLIYLHRIMDVRFGGASGRNLRMFRKLCGDDNLANVVLATTFWKTPASEIEEQREAQLQADAKFWKPMIDKGSKVFRQDRDMESGIGIIRYLLNKRERVVLSIQHELVEGKKSIAQTGAGGEVLAEMAEMRKKYEKDMEKLKQDMKEAIAERDQYWQEQIQKDRAEKAAQMAKNEKAKSKVHTKLSEYWSGFKDTAEELAWEIEDRLDDGKCILM